jgi:hypothetical protein
VRYIGAGAVAAAGIVAVIKALPTMASSFAAVMRGLRGSGLQTIDGERTPRTDRDVPSWIVVAVPLAVIVTLVAVPGLLAGNMAFVPRLVAAIGVAIFGVCFVVVSSRIVGLIGVSSNPTSAMTLVTLLGASVVFVLCGWTDPSARAAILTVGRAPDNAVRIRDFSVSLHHAQFSCKLGRYFLSDLGSTNGTKVNGFYIKNHTLTDGDCVIFGKVFCVFEMPGEFVVTSLRTSRLLRVSRNGKLVGYFTAENARENLARSLLRPDDSVCHDG